MSRCPLVLALATGVLLALPPAAPAADPSSRTVTAIAAARVTLSRDLPRNDTAIGRAVDRARQRAVTQAIANAREQAGRLAAGAGVALGEILGMEELVPPHFGHWAYGTDGTFGPGKFCGRVRSRSFRRLPNGRRIAVGPVRTRRACRIPQEVQHTLKVTFAVS
jgi:uncharacterized protein DUF541